MIELQEPAEPLFALDRLVVRPQHMVGGREQQHVVFPLMIPLLSIVRTELGQDMAQAILAEEDQSRQAFGFHRSHPTCAYRGIVNTQIG